jgi:hypothetical protein
MMTHDSACKSGKHLPIPSEQPREAARQTRDAEPAAPVPGSGAEWAGRLRVATQAVAAAVFRIDGPVCPSAGGRDCSHSWRRCSLYCS